VAWFLRSFAHQLYIADWLPLEMQRRAGGPRIGTALQDQALRSQTFRLAHQGRRRPSLATRLSHRGRRAGIYCLIFNKRKARVLPSHQLPELLVCAVGSSDICSRDLLCRTPPSTERRSQGFLPCYAGSFPICLGSSSSNRWRRNHPWSGFAELLKSPPGVRPNSDTREKIAAHDSLKSPRLRFCR